MNLEKKCTSKRTSNNVVIDKGLNRECDLYYMLSSTGCVYLLMFTDIIKSYPRSRIMRKSSSIGRPLSEYG